MASNCDHLEKSHTMPKQVFLVVNLMTNTFLMHS